MSVSVVISVLNGEKYIAEAIQSALDQGPMISDVVVVDDGSRDRTVAVAEGMGDARVRVVPGHGKGLPAGRNTGARASSGDWLMFLDADDRLCPGAVARLLEAAEQDPGAEIVYGDYDRIGPDGTPIGNRSRLARRKPSGDILEALLKGNFIVVGVQIIARTAYERAGGYLESLRVCDDWHFWVRLAAVASYRFVPGLRVMEYRIHNSSIMHTRPRPFADFLPAIDAVYQDPLVTSRLGPSALARMRLRCEASMLGYIATEAVRLSAYDIAWRSTLRALFTSPGTSPYTLARVAGAFARL